MLVCMDIARIFARGPLVYFSRSFSRGSKIGETCFLPLKIKKTAIFAEIFKFLHAFRHPRLCVGKRSCHTIKNWCNLKRFRTILKSEVLLNLIHKMKCFTDQFKLCFCFCSGSYIYFCISNTTGILTENHSPVDQR